MHTVAGVAAAGRHWPRNRAPDPVDLLSVGSLSIGSRISRITARRAKRHEPQITPRRIASTAKGQLS